MDGESETNCKGGAWRTFIQGMHFLQSRNTEWCNPTRQSGNETHDSYDLPILAPCSRQSLLILLCVMAVLYKVSRSYLESNFSSCGWVKTIGFRTTGLNGIDYRGTDPSYSSGYVLKQLKLVGSGAAPPGLAHKPREAMPPFPF